ncbi:MAG: rhodanese-like domain-containing protein [Porphyromonadaceae bacterium]|nr:MAG: rhodanese-like domain-containing protein [Porphyromonadaceae bacterium]
MSFSVGSQLQYTPREAFKRCQEGSVILDIRPELLCTYKAFDVPQVLYCPWQEIGHYLDKLPVEQEIIVADTSGIQSREVIQMLISAGFKKIAGLGGGMVEWERDGLPLVFDNQSRLSGSCMCQLKFRNTK